MSTLNKFLPLARHSATGLAVRILDAGNYCHDLAALVENETLRATLLDGRGNLNDVFRKAPPIDLPRLDRLGTITELLINHFADVPDVRELARSLRIVGLVQGEKTTLRQISGAGLPNSQEVTLFAGVCKFIGGLVQEWSSQLPKNDPDRLRIEERSRRGYSEEVILANELRDAGEERLVEVVSAMPWSVERSMMFFAAFPTTPALGILTGLALVEIDSPGPWKNQQISNLVGGLLEAGMMKVLSQGILARTLKRFGDQGSHAIYDLLEAKRSLVRRLAEIEETLTLLHQHSSSGDKAQVIHNLNTAKARLELTYRELDTRYLEYLMTQNGMINEATALVGEMKEMDKKLHTGVAYPRMDEGGISFEATGGMTEEDMMITFLNPDNVLSFGRKGNKVLESVVIRAVIEKALKSENVKLQEAAKAYCRDIIASCFSMLSVWDRVYFAGLNLRLSSEGGLESALEHMDRSLEMVESQKHFLLVPIARALSARSQNETANRLLNKILILMMDAPEPAMVLDAVRIVMDRVGTAEGFPILEKLHSLLAPTLEQAAVELSDVGGKVTIDSILGLFQQPEDVRSAMSTANDLYDALKVERPGPLSSFEIQRDAMTYLDHLSPGWREKLV